MNGNRNLTITELPVRDLRDAKQAWTLAYTGPLVGLIGRNVTYESVTWSTTASPQHLELVDYFTFVHSEQVVPILARPDLPPNHPAQQVRAVSPDAPHTSAKGVVSRVDDVRESPRITVEAPGIENGASTGNKRDYADIGRTDPGEDSPPFTDRSAVLGAEPDARQRDPIAVVASGPRIRKALHRAKDAALEGDERTCLGELRRVARLTGNGTIPTARPARRAR